MTYQDEFARRLGTARGRATGEDAAESRHPEPVSGPRASEPADGGKTDEILSRQAIEDNQVQDDDCSPLPNHHRQNQGDSAL